MNRTARHVPFSSGGDPKSTDLQEIVVSECEGELRLQPLDDRNQRERSFDREA